MREFVVLRNTHHNRYTLKEAIAKAKQYAAESKTDMVVAEVVGVAATVLVAYTGLVPGDGVGDNTEVHIT